VPQYTPATEQKENMEALINLLLRSEKPDPVEIAELHRELGDYPESVS
jgi:Fic family protein